MPRSTIVLSLIILGLVATTFDADAAQTKAKSQAPKQNRQRNCYVEAEQRYPDPTSPNTARNRQMWVWACMQGVPG